jgi:hypothetical protein
LLAFVDAERDDLDERDDAEERERDLDEYELRLSSEYDLE